MSDLPLLSTIGNLKLNPNARGSLLSNYKPPQTHHKPVDRRVSVAVAVDVARDARIDKLLESTNVSYKDIPVIRELLSIQKKIRNVLEDWQLHCRNSLKILSPELYIFSQPIDTKCDRLNKNHRDFNKIILHSRKSKSVLGISDPNSLQGIDPQIRDGKSLLSHDLTNLCSIDY